MRKGHIILIHMNTSKLFSIIAIFFSLFILYRILEWSAILVIHSAPKNNREASWLDPLITSRQPKQAESAIRHIINTQMHIVDEDTTVQKSEKIALYLLRQLAEKRGEFSRSAYKSAFDLWVDIIDGKKSVACYEFALMYAMFSHAVGIPTRLVYLGPFLRLPYHTVAESYSEEEKTWFMVDLQYYLLRARGENRELLTTIEYRKAIQNIYTSHALITLDSGDTVKNVSYQEYMDSLGGNEREYFTRASTISYRLYLQAFSEQITEFPLMFPGI